MKSLRGIEKINFFFLLLCYAFTLAMALNHVLNLRMSNYDDGDCKTITCSLSLSLPPTWKVQAFFHFKMLNFNAPLWKFQRIQNCEKLLIFFSATLCNFYFIFTLFSIVDFNFNKVEPRYFISILLCISKFYFNF